MFYILDRFEFQLWVYGIYLVKMNISFLIGQILIYWCAASSHALYFNLSDEWSLIWFEGKKANVCCIILRWDRPHQAKITLNWMSSRFGQEKAMFVQTSNLNGFKLCSHHSMNNFWLNFFEMIFTHTQIFASSDQRGDWTNYRFQQCTA